MSYRKTGRPPGRPPHPGLLTPAEERVLDGVRRGLTNAQIAEELGLAADTVKYHVANMLSKLYMEDRRQLAEWAPERGPRGLGVVAWLAAALRRAGPSAGRLAGPTVLAGAALALAVFAMIAVRAGGPIAAPPPGQEQAASLPGTTVPLVMSQLVSMPPGVFQGAARPQFVHDLASGVTLAVWDRSGGAAGPAWRPGTDVAAVSVGSRLALFHARLKRWQITNLPAPSALAWSPDGARLAYVGSRGRRLVVVDFRAGTARVMRATGGAFGIPGRPWSPDGTEIVVRSAGTFRTLDVASGAWRLADPAGALESVEFLGRGAHGALVFAGRSAGGAAVLRLVDARGVTEDRTLPSALDPASAALAPGGGHIAFRLVALSRAVVILEAATLRFVGRLHGAGRIRWSPDGRLAALYPTRCGVDDAITVSDTETHNVTRLAGVGGVPLWSGDQRWVAFGRGPDLLYLVGPGGAGSTRRLALQGVRGFEVTDWAPGGRFLSLAGGGEMPGRCAVESGGSGM